jgi:hypothetical protein
MSFIWKLQYTYIINEIMAFMEERREKERKMKCVGTNNLFVR